MPFAYFIVGPQRASGLKSVRMEGESVVKVAVHLPDVAQINL
jgi:hypothetical protein